MKAVAHSRLALHPLLSRPLSPTPDPITINAQLLDFGPGDMVLPLLEACKMADLFLPIHSPLPAVPTGLGYGRLPPDMAEAPASAVSMASVELAARMTLLTQEFSLAMMKYDYHEAGKLLERLESEIRTSQELINRGDRALREMSLTGILPDA